MQSGFRPHASEHATRLKAFQTRHCVEVTARSARTFPASTLGRVPAAFGDRADRDASFSCKGGRTRRNARSLLRIREDDIERSVPVTAKIGRVRFDEAATDVLNDYRTNRKRSLDDVARHIEKHLAPFFGNRKITSITTADIRESISSRQ